MAHLSDKRKWVVFGTLTIAFIGFSIFLYGNLPATIPSNAEMVLKGKRIWQERNCGACHQVYGLGGYLGPDLTNVYSKGAGYIQAFVRSGTAVMPAFPLQEGEMEALVEFFRHLDASGKSDPRTFKIYPNGTIAQ